MAGLPNNNNSSRTLKQWQQLFMSQSATHFAESYSHWNNVKGMGIPTCKHEHWKYTKLEGLLSHHFISTTACKVSIANLEALSFKIDACRLVFVDGHYDSLLSDPDTGFWKIKIEKGAARQSLPAPIQPEIFLHLTESLSKETTRIYLPNSNIAARPLYILHISQGSENKETLNMVHYRHHIDIGDSAQGQVIEHFVSLDPKGHFCGARTSMVVGNNAHLSHIKLACENSASYHFGHNDISISRTAVVHSSTFIFGAKLTRHQTSAQMNGEGSNLVINSLIVPSGKDISDNRTYIEHNNSYCLSRQLHKFIVRDFGKGVFNGLIKVANKAIKTDGKMINNNLLLNPLAEVNTKPQLEIYTDDVKCNHGATIGHIDEEQIFYLCSRGITRKDAQKIIIYAFAAEVTEIISQDAVRNMVLAHIAAALEVSK
ncbi:FeS cluster assembly protein SufD [Candidatus Mikella endobia]|uniref:FeS cluster assembly protein SufD n=1 Tax=Candidatus Mikella endobia TaxID=1778264 RepID=A0A143WQJ0_9ENTR|nr:Fe-S cluster assembly protein SufD [Candidatus Mikella endobia]CUX96002.1 FeS cluster assembly protein SufD [Candidatus Mikella endobia]